MEKELWKVSVAIEGYDVLVFKVWATSRENAESEIGWRMDWLEGVPWTVVDAIRCKEFVYGE